MTLLALIGGLVTGGYLSVVRALLLFGFGSSDACASNVPLTPMQALAVYTMSAVQFWPTIAVTAISGAIMAVTSLVV